MSKKSKLSPGLSPSLCWSIAPIRARQVPGSWLDLEVCARVSFACRAVQGRRLEPSTRPKRRGVYERLSWKYESKRRLLAREAGRNWKSLNHLRDELRNAARKGP